MTSCFSTTGKGPFQTGKAHLQLQAAGHSQLCHFLKYTVRLHRTSRRSKILYRKIHNVNDTTLGSEVEQSKILFKSIVFDYALSKLLMT